MQATATLQSEARQRLQPNQTHRPQSPKLERAREKPQRDEHQSQPSPVNGIGALSHTVFFGQFCLDLRRRELLADGVHIPVGNRALDVLLVLIEAHGKLVTKDELLSRVWPNTIVEENTLQFQISMLRKALGKDRDFIRTASGRGYRFIAQITIAELETDIYEANPDRGQTNLAVSNLVDCGILDTASLIAVKRLNALMREDGSKTLPGIERAQRFPFSRGDGDRLVQHERLSDSGLTPQTFASALQLAARLATLEGQPDALASVDLLLVLDNCRHAIVALAGIAERLLQASSSRHAIAANREPLTTVPN